LRPSPVRMVGEQAADDDVDGHAEDGIKRGRAACTLRSQTSEKWADPSIGAARGRASAGGAADAVQRLPAAAVADARRCDRAGDPEAPARVVLSELPGAAPPLRAGARFRRARGIRRRRLDAQVDQVVESLGLRISKSEVSRLCRPRRAGRRLPRARRSRGRYPYLSLDAKVEKVRDGGRVGARRSCSPMGWTSPAIGR
jgi:Transposase, Mutator family